MHYVVKITMYTIMRSLSDMSYDCSQMVAHPTSSRLALFHFLTTFLRWKPVLSWAPSFSKIDGALHAPHVEAFLSTSGNTLYLDLSE